MTERRGGWWAILPLLVLAGWALLTPVLAPETGLQADLAQSRLAPSAAHWFGTDNSGRDLLVRVAQGLRVSLAIALVCAVLSVVIGTLVGSVAAVVGGWVDELVMRLADVTNALPHLLLGIVVVAFYPGSVVAIVSSVALTHWPQVARLVRAVALGVRSMEYIEAAYLAGATRRWVLCRHLVPAAAGQALVALVLLLPHAIWHESTLSFLGLGLSPDRASLGTLLAVSRGEVLLGGWWTLVFPAAALVLSTLAVSAAARALEARLSPRGSVGIG